MQFAVVIEGDERGGFSAYVPSLDGVYATGASEEIVKDRITSGIAFHIAQLRSAGDLIPPSSSHVLNVEVAV